VHEVTAREPTVHELTAREPTVHEVIAREPTVHELTRIARVLSLPEAVRAS